MRRFGVLGLRGPEPVVAEAPAPKSLKALKETAARALGFVHPQSGNVWKPRRLFTDTPSGNLRELAEGEASPEQVLWVEPPWAAGSVLAGGLTSHRQWGWGPWIWHRLSRIHCCAGPLTHFLRRRGAAAKGGRGSERRDPPKPRRKAAAKPSHFVALRVGPEAQQRAAKLQKDLMSKARGQVQKGLERCLVPASKLHVTMLVLTLRSQQDVEVAKAGLDLVASEFAEELSGPLQFRLSGLDSFGDKVLFAKVRPEDEGVLLSLRRRLLERMGETTGAEVASTTATEESPCAEPESARAVDSLPAPSNEKLSRYLTRVLRHDAVRLGLALRSDGSVGLQELLSLPFFQTNGFTEKDVEAEVLCNEKKRFQLWTEDASRRIRANQGHKMKQVLDSELLQPIERAEDLPVCIHGTYFTKWSSKKQCRVDVWKQIKQEGLKPMGRNHIHFVPHEVGSRTVISGMREDCSVAIYLDVPKTLGTGIKLYRSANDVILTRGDESGRIPPSLFQRVVEIQSGRSLWPIEEPCREDVDSDASVEEVEGGGFQPHATLAKVSLAQGKARIPKACWQDLRETDLGLVATSSLELCKMKGDAGGYYEIEATFPLESR